jgi:GTPase
MEETSIAKELSQNKLLSPEIEDGNVEYKLRLDLKDAPKLKKMASQMLWRMNEGKSLCGKYLAIYVLGIRDNGTPGNISETILNESIKMLNSVVVKCKAEIIKINKFVINGSHLAEVHIQKRVDNGIIDEYRVCFLGSSGVGKTSTMGFLTYEQKDNGNGYSRSLVLKHTHEQNTGITSSIKQDIIGIKNNKIINYKSGVFMTWEKIVNGSDKIINLIDLPGSSKYSKTTFFGILNYRPCFNLIFFDINSIDEDSLFNIYMSITMKIPFGIIFNKSDLMSKLDSEKETKISNNVQIIQNYIEKYNSIMKLKEYHQNLNYSAHNIPYIVMSNVSGENSEMLCKFFDDSRFVNKNIYNFKYSGTCYIINDVFHIPDTGYVVSGLLLNGKINVNNDYLIGPINEKFHKVSIRNIHKKQVDSKTLYINETGSFELFMEENIEINKNLVIVDKDTDLDQYLLSKIKIKLANNEDKNKLNIGFQYTLFNNNIIEPIIIHSIEDDEIEMSFVKKTKKFIIPETNCIIRGDYVPEILIFGTIL